MNIKCLKSVVISLALSAMLIACGGGGGSGTSSSTSSGTSTGEFQSPPSSAVVVAPKN